MPSRHTRRQGSPVNLEQLSSQLRNERFNIEKFRSMLASAINGIARTQLWSAYECSIGLEYGESLVDGDGFAPRELNRHQQALIQKEFVRLCRELGATDLPGQRQSWFPRERRAS